MEARLEGGMNGWKDERVGRCVDGREDGWMDGWWLDEVMDECVSHQAYTWLQWSAPSALFTQTGMTWRSG
jgi:hypothetical protein